MELNEFTKLFAEQFDETPVEMFKPSTVYKDLEAWDSLAALTIMAMVDEEMEVKITGADIRNCSTIEDLFNLVLTK